ncbi:hypothetical protein JCM13210_09900 [Thermaerobacter litoralis]
MRHWLQCVYRPEAEELELYHYYRALDVLAKHKETIENRVFARAHDLLWTDVDVVMWDAHLATSKAADPRAWPPTATSARTGPSWWWVCS